MIWLLAIVSLLSATQDARVITAVRAAVAPALPFPNSDEAGAVPANGNAEALWMVRPLQPGDQSIEVIANPLNDVNQLRAARAMAQIESNIQSAQRRAELQYERAVAEAKRTGKSQEVDGVTLADEGVAGAKIDADSHVTIEVAFNQPSYAFEVASAMESLSTTTTMEGSSVMIGMPASTYRDDRGGADRYSEAQTFVFLGRMPAPQVRKLSGQRFDIIATADTPFLVVRLKGNEALITDLVRKTNWNLLLELLK